MWLHRIGRRTNRHGTALRAGTAAMLIIAVLADGHVSGQAAAAQAEGETYRWTQSSGGRFDHHARWSPRGVPGPDDVAIFDLDESGTIQFRDDEEIFRLRLDHGWTRLAFGQHTLTVNSESTDSPSISVGLGSGDAALLELEDGTLAGVHGAVGLDEGAFGHVRVLDDANWLQEGWLHIGRAGEGLVEQTGGEVHVGQALSVGLLDGSVGAYELDGGTLETHGLLIGRDAGSEGTVSITESSAWSNTGDIEIGRAGRGSLTLGGQTMELDTVGIGVEAGGNGLLSLTGGSQWEATRIGVGVAGAGAMQLSEGARVTTEELILGEQAGASGVLHMTGTDTQLDLGIQSLIVGQSGDGEARIGEGAKLISRAVRVATESGSYGELHLESGAAWDGLDHGALVIGSEGAGVGHINTGDIQMGVLAVGHGQSSEGHLTISGPDAQWNIDRSTTIGNQGYGYVLVEQGAHITHGVELDVSRRSYIGRRPTGEGKLEIVGPDTHWSAGPLYVGDEGVGRLTVRDGATGGTNHLHFGEEPGGVGTGLITGPGTEWTALQGGVRAGVRGTGTFSLTDGARLDTRQVVVGEITGSHGFVHVSGQGTELISHGPPSQDRGLFYIGGRGHGEVEFSDGAYGVHGFVRVGAFSGSSGTATVRGENTFLDVERLGVGLSGQGQLHLLDGARIHALGDSREPDELPVLVGRLAEGELRVAGADARLTMDGAMAVARSADAALTVADGGSIETDALAIAEDEGTHATVDVHGPGATLNVANEMTLARHGESHLTVADGATLTADTLFTAVEDGSAASVTVAGPGASLVVDGDVHFGATGSTPVTVRDGGRLEGHADFRIGYFGENHSPLTVTGEGTRFIADYLNLYTREDTPMTVTDGAHVTSGAASLWGDATGLIAGPDTTWDGGTLVNRLSGGLTIRDGATVTPSRLSAGTGTITIEGETTTAGRVDGTIAAIGANLYARDGATLHSNRGEVRGAFEGRPRIVLEGPQTSWRVEERLEIGHRGAGEVYVRDGATLEGGYAELGRLNRDDRGAEGLLVVEGSGSRISLESDGWRTALMLGSSEFHRPTRGELIVRDGGEAHIEAVSMGFGTNVGRGIVSVTGSGSNLTAEDLWVGDFYIGEFTVDAGGFVQSEETVIGRIEEASGTVKVSDVESFWRNTGNVYVGHAGAGAMTIEAGAVAHHGRAFIAHDESANGSVTIDGAGSRWQIDQDLFVSGNASDDGGTADVRISDDAHLDVGGQVHIRPDGDVHLEGGRLTADHVELSQDATFTFTGGTLETATFAGDLYNDGGAMRAPAGSSQTGSTSITGSLTQNQGSRLHANIHSADAFDLVQVGDVATLGGELALELSSDFSASIGDQFHLLSAQTVEGHFDSISGMHVDDSLILGVFYDETTVGLRALLPGDVTGDGAVGGADLDQLLANWGQNVPAGVTTAGDLTGNGFVGGSDLDLLLSHWGDQVSMDQALATVEARLAMPGSDAAAATAVPEPTTFTLVGLAGLLMLRRQARCSPTAHADRLGT